MTGGQASGTTDLQHDTRIILATKETSRRTVVDLNPQLFEQVRWIARWQKVTTDELATLLV